jgi:hypothetical protein
MTRPRSAWNSATEISAAAAAVLLIGGSAYAVTSNVFKYSASKIGYFGIDPMALAPDGADSAKVYSIEFTGALSATGGSCFATGVHLPNRARMTALQVWYSSGASHNPLVHLRRHGFDRSGDAIFQRTIVDNTSVRKSVNIRITDAALATIDNAHYTYGFGICLDNGDNFFSARIAYTYEDAGS